MSSMMDVEDQYTQQQQQQQQEQQVTGAPIDEPPDCTIACDKGHITVHKLVLCEHSKYLREILSKYPTAEHPIIILTELNIVDVRILVYFMYTGELVITNDASPTSLLRAAQILKIDSLTADDDEPTGHEYSSATSPPPPAPLNHQPPSSHQNNNSRRHNNILNNNNIGAANRNAAAVAAAINNSSNNNIDDDDDNMIFQTERSSSSISHNNSINNSINELEFQDRAASRDDDDDVDEDEDPLDINDTELEAAARDAITDPLDKNNKIRCHLCNIGLSDVKCLYRHVLTRHLPEKWGYKCEFCDREFSRDDHLMRHYTTKHKNMEFDREKIRETRRLNREMAKNFHDQISTA